MEEENFNPKAKTVAILGAGGSAKAVAYALAEAGISQLDIINRTVENAEALKALLDPHFPKLKIECSQSLTSYDLLLNTTSFGMKAKECPASPQLIASASFVCDIIYNHAQSELLAQAAAMGKPAQNGISMLLFQGVLALELWTKQPAPVKVMAKVLKNHLSLVSGLFQVSIP